MTTFEPEVQLPAEPTDTQVAAAARVLPRTGTQRRKVYDFIASRGSFGATDEQIQAALRMNPNTQRPRRVELARDGLVVDSRQRRRTLGGDRAIVWIAA